MLLYYEIIIISVGFGRRSGEVGGRSHIISWLMPFVCLSQVRRHRQHPLPSSNHGDGQTNWINASPCPFTADTAGIGSKYDSNSNRFGFGAPGWLAGWMGDDDKRRAGGRVCVCVCETERRMNVMSSAIRARGIIIWRRCRDDVALDGGDRWLAAYPHTLSTVATLSEGRGAINICMTIPSTSSPESLPLPPAAIHSFIHSFGFGF